MFEITASETATIDGRQWDTPIPGGMTIDAVHRSVLLRFPTAADEIADLLRSRPRAGAGRAGAALTAAYEIVPEGYTLPRRSGPQGCGPRIRRAGTSRPGRCAMPGRPTRRHGPTFNASVNGKRYWARYGASDRSATACGELGRAAGAVEVHDARRASTSPSCWRRAALEREAGERLRWLEQRGLPAAQARDLRYALPRSGRRL